MLFRPVLSLDLGMTTLGIAVSRSGHMATGLANLKFPNGKFEEAWQGAISFAKKESVGTIVLGRPCYPSGDPTEMTGVVESFSAELRKRMDAQGLKDVKLELQDEQGSTLEAAKELHGLGLNSKKQKPDRKSVV